MAEADHLIFTPDRWITALSRAHRERRSSSARTRRPGWTWNPILPEAVVSSCTSATCFRSTRSASGLLRIDPNRIPPFAIHQCLVGVHRQEHLPRAVQRPGIALGIGVLEDVGLVRLAWRLIAEPHATVARPLHSPGHRRNEVVEARCRKEVSRRVALALCADRSPSSTTHLAPPSASQPVMSLPLNNFTIPPGHPLLRRATLRRLVATDKHRSITMASATANALRDIVLILSLYGLYPITCCPARCWQFSFRRPAWAAAARWEPARTRTSRSTSHPRSRPDRPSTRSAEL